MMFQFKFVYTSKRSKEKAKGPYSLYMDFQRALSYNLG